LHDFLSPLRLSGGLISLFLRMDYTGIELHRVSPLELVLDIKHSLLMLNIFSVNVSVRSCGPLPYIFDIHISWSADHSVT